MGKQLIINAFYEIRYGLTRGFKGKLVAYDAIANKATIQVEENLTINTNSENLKLVDYYNEPQKLKCWCCQNENVVKGQKCNNCGEIV